MSIKNTKYKPEYCERMIDFFSQEPFEVVKDEMGEICYTQSGKPIFKPIKYPTMDMFAKSLGVNRDTIFEWASVHKEFGKAKENAIELAKNIVIQNGLIGAYNSTFCIFMCKANFGMRDGGEMDQQGDSVAEALNKIADKLPD